MRSLSRVWLAVVFLCIALTIANFAVAGQESKIDYQLMAKGANWGWHEEMANPLSCIAQDNSKYEIRLVKLPDKASLRIEVWNGRVCAHSWEGHKFSVFQIVGDTLFYAKFEFFQDSAEIVAVDLKKGEVKWRSRLSNPFVISQTTPGGIRLNLDAHENSILVYAVCDGGRFLEIKSAASGETVGRKSFPDKDSATKESEQ